MTDKMREEFEAWYINDGYGDRRPTRHLEGYAAPNVNDMWLSWQASRAALRVDIPEEGEESSFGNYVVFDRDAVIEMLKAAGVRYK